METGKLYFFTASVNNWTAVFGDKNSKKILLDSFQYLSDNKLCKISGFVIMPNHIHVIWKPLDEKLQLKFLKFTAQKVKFHLQDNDAALLEKLLVGKKDRQYQIWQRNPLAFELYSREVIEQKLDYLHNNPCQGKWMLVDDPLEYPYSSFSFYESADTRYSFLTHYMEVMES